MLSETGGSAAESTVVDIEGAAYAEGRGLPASPQLVGRSVSRGWDARFARLISNAASPPVLACAVVALVCAQLSSARAWVWGGVYAFVGVLVPFLYVVWLVQRGDVTDIDVQLRKQRVQPLVVTILCSGLGWLATILGLAPTMITVVAGSLWLLMAAVFAITLRWKISVHAASAAGAATMIWILLGTPLPLVLGVPLVAWSRVRLRRHTFAQTAVGAVLGLVVFAGAAIVLHKG